LKYALPLSKYLKEMTLEEKIMGDLKTAMKEKNQADLRGIRAIKAALLIAKTDGSGDEMNEEREIKLLQKLVKQRRDSLEIFEKQNREDLAVVEREEIAVLERYLPEQLTGDALEAALKQIIEETGATSAKDMGKVIGAANKSLAGKAEGKLIAEAVKRLLG
jgi:uncharacterized protein